MLGHEPHSGVYAIVDAQRLRRNRQAVELLQNQLDFAASNLRGIATQKYL